MKRVLLILVSIVCISQLLLAQDHKVTVTGTVRDNTGAVLPGVTVYEKSNRLNGTATNQIGEYQIVVSSGNSILVFSYIGLTPQEQPVNNRTQIQVVLIPDVQELKDVVVIGYGTVKKSDLTGSVSSVTMKGDEMVPRTSVEQMIQGKAAGVMITTTSAKPGGAISVKIRGNNSINAGNEPLYVIDGFPVTSNEYDLSSGMTSGGPVNPLVTLDPNDIESIEVLKDASATAIYGARATNGVVLITTRRGKVGKMKIDANYTQGIQKIRKKMDMLNAAQFATLVNEALVNEGLAPKYPNPDSLGKGTDWQDALFRQAPTSDLNLTFSGGQNGTTYYMSTNYYKQQGIIQNTNLDRLSMRLGLDMNLKSWLTAGTTLNLSNVVSNNSETAGWGVVNTALMFNPILPVKDENGDYTLMNDRTIFTGNPIALATEADSRSNTSRAISNSFLQATLFGKLIVRSSIGIDAGYNKEVYYYPSYILAGMDAKGSAGIGNLLNTSLLNENTVKYKLTLAKKHDFDFLAGFTVQKSRNEVTRVAVEGFSEDILRYNSLNAASKISSFPYSYAQQWSMLSYLGRVNYSFANKLLLTINGRIDGSSKFGTGNKYGFFPSVAAAYKLSEEKFLVDSKVINLLKIRMSYGTTGNQEIASYQSLAVLGITSYPIGGNNVIGYSPFQISNPNLRWETTNQFDAGLDVSLFDNRIQLTADYYFKKTKDLLLYVNLPISSGYPTALQNIGSVQNQGVEFTLSTKNLVGAFTWTTDFNIAFNRNKLLSLASEDSMPVASRINQLDPGWLFVGQPIGLFYGLKTNGLWQINDDIANSAQPNAKPGDIRYIDTNKDGVINMNDRQLIGKTEPKFFGGIMNVFNYRGFELVVFIQGMYGNQIWNGNLLSYEYPNGLYNQFTTVLDRWTPENADATVPRASAFMQEAYPMDRFVEDGSYLRLKTLSFSYELTNLFKIRGVQSCRIFFTGENLLTLTNYTGYDPEVNYFGKNYLAAGYDYGSYPSVKTYHFGFKISF
jgi:TonB-dependent starch-binding outer membrane protein SusC